MTRKFQNDCWVSFINKTNGQTEYGCVMDYQREKKKYLIRKITDLG